MRLHIAIFVLFARLLGSIAVRGEGVPEDDAKAVNWYRKATERGHATVQYMSGEGHFRDAEKLGGKMA